MAKYLMMFLLAILIAGCAGTEPVRQVGQENPYCKERGHIGLHFDNIYQYKSGIIDTDDMAFYTTKIDWYAIGYCDRCKQYVYKYNHTTVDTTVVWRKPGINANPHNVIIVPLKK